MFSLFLNDIELHLQENIDFFCIAIDQIAVYLLLFADDAVLISETREGLQKSLNSCLQSMLKRLKSWCSERVEG